MMLMEQFYFKVERLYGISSTEDGQMLFASTIYYSKRIIKDGGETELLGDHS